MALKIVMVHCISIYSDKATVIYKSDITFAKVAGKRKNYEKEKERDGHRAKEL